MQIVEYVGFNYEWLFGWHIYSEGYCISFLPFFFPKSLLVLLLILVSSCSCILLLAINIPQFQVPPLQPEKTPQ